MRQPSNIDPWLPVALAALVYITGVHILPSIPFQQPLINQFAQQLQNPAKPLSLFLLGLGGLKFVQFWVIGRQRRRLLATQTGIDSIRSLSWHQFEHLVGEFYRQQGYRVTEQGGAGADHGIDLMLHREGKTIPVQCKHWRSGKVGVSVVREHLGVMSAHKSEQGIVVCTGTFTTPAIQFAQANGIELVNGSVLATRIQLDQRPAANESQPCTKTEICSRCESPMIRRQAKRGAKAGTYFLGCSTYPTCRETRNLA